jgi:D-cysteine desulfhydrase family pyridoxal phosphate-dependent enzyme
MLPRLTALLGGPQLWVKRDDQTGLATGGNKTRKLEFLVAEALARGADTLVTGGAAQSNHARQTAAAAARFGLACTLVLRGQPPPQAQGNLLLDHLLGADIVWAEDAPLAERMAEVAESLQARGRRPYLIPYGGSNSVGVCGYVAAMEELLAQAAQAGLFFDLIVLASSSGGTQAGLAVAARALGYPGRILGISVDLPAAPLRQRITELANATADHLGLPLSFTPEDFAVEDGYLGGGYGVIGDREREAIRLLAQTEGLLLDPVYTGRAFGGLIDLIRRGAFSPRERVLFWHTGGVAGLFARPNLE